MSDWYSAVSLYKICSRRSLSQIRDHKSFRLNPSVCRDKKTEIQSFEIVSVTTGSTSGMGGEYGGVWVGSCVSVLKSLVVPIINLYRNTEGQERRVS